MSLDGLDNLVDAYLSGDAAPADCAALHEALRSDPAARRRLVERALLEVHLYRACSSGAAAPQALALARASVRPIWRRPVAYLAAAAAVVLAVGAGLAWRVTHPARQAPFHEVLSGSILVEGAPRERLQSGDLVRVAGAAPAVVRLTDGSRAELDPSSEVLLKGRVGAARQVVDLERGGGRFSVRPNGGPFRVDTPVGSVTALGTQFTVRLLREDRKEGERRRAMAVAVAEGSVRVDAGANSRTLAANESCLVSGGEFQAEQGRTVRATVTESAPERGTLVLMAGGDRPRPYDLRAAARIEVMVDGKAARLEDVRPGMQVLCRLSPDEKTALAIHATGPVVAGTLVGVDAAARTLTLTFGEEGGQQWTYAIAPGAAILVHGRPSALADLEPGTRITLQLSVDNRAVLDVRAGQPRPQRREGRREGEGRR